MSDGRGATGDEPADIPGFGPGAVDEGDPATQSVPFVSSGENPLQLFEIERASAYFVTGGLVALHAPARDHHSTWDALQRKELYATPRVVAARCSGSI